MVSNEKPSVIIHRGQLAANLRLERLARGYIPLAKELNSRDFEVGFTNGIESFNVSEEGTFKGVPVYKWQEEQVATQPEVTDPIGIGSIRDLADSLGNPKEKYHRTQDAVVKTGITIINDRHVRAFENKAVIVDPLWQPRTEVIDGQTLPEVLSSMPGEKVVFKPAVAAASRGLIVIPKTEALSPEVTAALSAEPYVVQEYLYHSGSWGATGLHSANPENDQLLESDDRLKQLRLYCFWGDGVDETRRLRGVARISDEGQQGASGGKYIFINQDTVPQELRDETDKLFSQISAQTGSEHILGACDFVFGHTDDRPSDRWYIMELNLWRPGMVQPREDQELAHDLVLAQADLLGAAALKSLIARGVEL